MCKYFPCHDKEKLESCLFCYCPIYPCYLPETKGKISGKVWDCSDCTIIHSIKLVEKIKEFIKEEIKKDTSNENNLANGE